VAHPTLLLKHSFTGIEEEIRKGKRYYGSVSSVPASHLGRSGFKLDPVTSHSDKDIYFLQSHPPGKCWVVPQIEP